MHYCEMLVGGGAPGSTGAPGEPAFGSLGWHDEPCDSPATVRYQGEWFCEYHYQALVDLDSHWQALFHAADRCEPYEFNDVDEDGGLVEFEAVEFELTD